MLMSRATGHKPEVKIHITKRIFQAAGLAGGSTDGAAVLRGLNKLWQTGLTDRELEKLAEELGSDVPFCIKGGTVRATGRGEILSPLPDVPKLWLVLAKPRNLAVSTPWVYKNFQQEAVLKPTNEEAIIQAIKEGNRQELLKYMSNDLETVTLPAYPILKDIKSIMEKAGAEKTLMSGSGPTLFGIVPDENTAKQVAAALKATQAVEINIAVTTKGEMDNGK
jgi:4-diphosphocytidyl-2-C-methyl-D-erythritol kinase